LRATNFLDDALQVARDIFFSGRRVGADAQCFRKYPTVYEGV
jgi:hypothetical protein